MIATRSRKELEKDGIKELLQGQLDVMIKPTPYCLKLKNLNDTPYIIERLFIKFLHRLSNKTYKRQYKKHKKMINYIAVIEGDFMTPYHIHCVLDTGGKITKKHIIDLWETIIEKHTIKTDKKMKHNDDKIAYPTNDIGITYLLKDRSKTPKKNILEHFILH